MWMDPLFHLAPCLRRVEQQDGLLACLILMLFAQTLLGALATTLAGSLSFASNSGSMNLPHDSPYSNHVRPMEPGSDDGVEVIFQHDKKVAAPSRLVSVLKTSAVYSLECVKRAITDLGYGEVSESRQRVVPN